MADECLQIVAMGESSVDSDDEFQVYEAGTDLVCVIGVDNKQTSVKTPGVRPRYKQYYREAWESMRDFKGWLSSVPGNNSKAYCKLCQKELHCHRLSLLKHKVTFKHQKKEEELKLSTAQVSDEKDEPSPKKPKEDSSGESDESSDRQNIEEDTDTEDTLISSKPTTSETSNLFQNNKEEPDLKDGLLSTHILDISKGLPATLVHVVLYKLIDGRWMLANEGVTNSKGRYGFFVTNHDEFTAGRYKLHFDLDKYFQKQNQETVFPFVEVVFDVKDAMTRYHIPLLVSPFGYSTYKGS